MKRNLQLVAVGVLSSSITLGAFYFLQGGTGRVVTLQTAPPQTNNLQLVNQKGTAVIGPDFSEVASQVVNSVVNIQNTSVATARGGMNDIFGDMFRDLPPGFRMFPDGGNEGGGRENTQKSTGSGVILNKEGYIVTNNHVVENAKELEVTLHDNRTYKAKVIGTDPSTDLAVIQIKAPDLVPVVLGNSEETKVGQWVLAVGNPFNLSSTVTAGVVSAKGRSIGILRDKYRVESFIQTDAAVNPGNSGGALVNLSGQLIGINTAIASPTGSYAGYSFAVPTQIVQKVVKDLIEFGAVQRGLLGITIRDVNNNLAREKELDLNEGVYIDSVGKESAGAAAGLKSGDVITGVEGSKVGTTSRLQEIISTKRPGDKVKLEVKRGNQTLNLTATLKTAEGKTELASAEERNAFTKLGITLTDATSGEKLRWKINGGAKITKINSGQFRNQQPTVKESFIITRIDKKEVKTAKEAEKLIKESAGVILIEGIYAGNGQEEYFALSLN